MAWWCRILEESPGNIVGNGGQEKAGGRGWLSGLLQYSGLERV